MALAHGGVLVWAMVCWNISSEVNAECQSSWVCSRVVRVVGAANHSRKWSVTMLWTSSGVTAMSPDEFLMTSRFRVSTCLRPPRTPRMERRTVFIFPIWRMCSLWAILAFILVRKSVRSRPCMSLRSVWISGSQSRTVGMRSSAVHQWRSQPVRWMSLSTSG